MICIVLNPSFIYLICGEVIECMFMEHILNLLGEVVNRQCNINIYEVIWQRIVYQSVNSHFDTQFFFKNLVFYFIRIYIHIPYFIII